MPNFPEPGLHIGVPNAVYHASNPISNSALKEFLKCPNNYRHRYIEGVQRKQTDALLLGSLIHKVMLEPDDLNNEFALKPDVNARTKEGKEELAKFRKTCKEQGLEVVSMEQLEQAIAVGEAAKKNKLVAELFSDGKPEISAVWRDKDTGLLCKCRPDWLRNDNVIVDLKTCQDAEPREVMKSIHKYGYAIQAAWYVHGMKQLGYDCKFVFAFVEKTPPYNCSVVEIDETMMRWGDMKWRKALPKLADAVTWNHWPSYASKVTTLSAPEWMKKELEGATNE